MHAKSSGLGPSIVLPGSDPARPRPRPVELN